MSLINQLKEQRQTDTPLLFFECTLPSGDVEHWSTHQVSLEGQTYQARVLKHNLFDLQLSAEDAMDGVSQISVTLANADSMLSELNAEVGFKGSQLTVYFAFADLQSAQTTTETTVLFKGVAGDPDEITEQFLSLSFINKLSLQRIPIPDVRIQRSCGWSFPASLSQRLEARDGGADGRLSRYFRCGYSADLVGGSGNLVGGEVYTSCDKSRAQCEARGMFHQDATGNLTSRFGGLEFVPSAISVRTTGDKTLHTSPVLANAAKYNDAVPLVYGTGWLKAPVIFSRNDGNLTHLEVVLGLGPITGILKVVVNDIEIPQAVVGQNMTATGWYSLTSTGSRTGAFNTDFLDQNGLPLGDPHGSIASVSVVVPNRVSTGTALPNIEVLLQGNQVDTYDSTLNRSVQYSNNPAWIILDLLKRAGWLAVELNLSLFVNAAAFCNYLITTTDLNGNQIQVPRSECNLIIAKRQSAASLIRGVRVASSLMLRYGSSGLLELLPEATIAQQQPTLPDGGNSTSPLDGGWPAYEFSDGSAPFSALLRNPDGSSSLKLTSRTIAETSNRLSVEFQDAMNEYQQDSLSVVDSEDVDLIGYEISSQSTALGISNYSQATRVLLKQLDKLTKGNLFIQFQTSFKAFRIRPGDLIALTYLKEGLNRFPFRVMKLSPSLNYQTVEVLAQIHNDDWYSDDPAVLMGAGRQPGSQNSMPRPLFGLTARFDENRQFELFDFAVSEEISASVDGTAVDRLTVGFSQPSKPSARSRSVPLVSLSPQIEVLGGNLAGDSIYYYAITSTGGDGQEGPLSFTVPASVPTGTNTNTVTINGISVPSDTLAINLYRGTSPQILYRVLNQSTAASVTDSGLANQPYGPPDPNFDHANFFYRYEYAGPFMATDSGSNCIGCQNMGATASAFSNMLVRIIGGTGRGQDRVIQNNTEVSIVISGSWSTVPDTSSTFVICEAAWHFAAVTSVSPAQFDIPFRSGTVIQISGRAANTQNQEASVDLCPVTRFALGQGKTDAGLAPMPNFNLDAPGAGLLTLSQIGFSSAINVGSITGGTLRLYFWNELNTPSTFSTLSVIDESQADIAVSTQLRCSVGDVIQIEAELMFVSSVNVATGTYSVVRGVLGSQPSSHLLGSSILCLTSSVITTSFATNFFLNRASVDFIHPFQLADARVSAAEFFVTNSFGDSLTQIQCYTGTLDQGLRTLSGGQLTMQLSGYVHNQINATPATVVDTSHATRDIRASVSQAASGYAITIDVFQNQLSYCQLQIPSGKTMSNLVSGTNLPPLLEGGIITTNLSLTPEERATGIASPGKDLTVTMRF